MTNEYFRSTLRMAMNELEEKEKDTLLFTFSQEWRLIDYITNVMGTAPVQWMDNDWVDQKCDSEQDISG